MQYFKVVSMNKKLQTDLITAFMDAERVLSVFYNEPKNMEIVSSLAEKISIAFQNNNKVLICGNGGSACDAMHFAEEFTGRYRQDRKALPVIHLGDVGHVTCVANDYGYEEVFARGVEAYGQPGDWLVGLSTSGNSANVIKAFQKAKQLGVHTCALLGKEGGKTKGLCDVELIIKGMTTDRIQEVHMTILHIVIEGVERILFPEHYL
jgi:D-sedoheptulose 7-phosphate isomerase